MVSILKQLEFNFPPKNQFEVGVWVVLRFTDLSNAVCISPYIYLMA